MVAVPTQKPELSGWCINLCLRGKSKVNGLARDVYAAAILDVIIFWSNGVERPIQHRLLPSRCSCCKWYKYTNKLQYQHGNWELYFLREARWIDEDAWVPT